MFDIGFLELAVMGVIALLVLGPEKLPGFARQAGRMVGRMQRMASDLKSEFEREAEFQELKKLREEFESSEFKSAARDLRTSASDLKRTLHDRVDLGAGDRHSGDSSGGTMKETGDEDGAPAQSQSTQAVSDGVSIPRSQDNTGGDVDDR